MRSRVIIQVEEKERTVYGCDACDFEARDTWSVDRHYGQVHAVKASEHINGMDFLRIETEHDYTLYKAFRTAGARCKHEWSGPGWYGESAVEGFRSDGAPCTYWTIKRADSVLEEWREQRRNVTEGIFKLKKLVK